MNFSSIFSQTKWKQIGAGDWRGFGVGNDKQDLGNSKRYRAVARSGLRRVLRLISEIFN
jgi:hypothetical protein